MRRLAAAGHEVIVLLHTAASPRLLEEFASPRVSLQVMDLERPDFARLPAGIEAVVALAQSQHFRNFPEKAGQIFAVNVAAHLALLEWARLSGVRRMVYASSGGIYGPSARMRVAESDLLAVDSPLGFYLGSKLCAEVLFHNYRHFFETAVVLRPFFIYGPGQRRDMLIPRLVDSVREGRPIRLQGRDGLRLNPIFVEDAAEGFAAALSVKGCEVLNLAGPQMVSLRDIGNRIGAALGRDPQFEVAEGAVSDYVADTSRAAAVIGPARIDFDQGIARMIEADK